MEEDFILVLKRSGDVREIVGDRISLDTRPQTSDDPAIVVARVSGGHEHDLGGSAGFARPVIHVMCFATSAIKANRLRDAARLALQGFSGVVGRTNFGAVILDEEDHDYQPGTDANDSGTYSRLLVFTVLHGEQIPAFS